MSTIAILIVLVSTSANAGESVIDLNGFRLWQFKGAADAYFGKPIHTQRDNDRSFEVFKVSKDSFLVVEIRNRYENNIYSIQISGYPTAMIPFKGLVLGDSANKVEQVLGRPSDKKKLDQEHKTVNTYGEANYSTEIDASGRLCSIKIFVTDEMMNEANQKEDTWGAFSKAVKSKEMQAILDWVRPDIEIFKDGKNTYIMQRYEDFRAKPAGDFVKAFIGEKESILMELSRSAPEMTLRVMENMGVGRVYKFQKGKTLKEMVFFPYNGKFRAYEIKFREKADGKK